MTISTITTLLHTLIGFQTISEESNLNLITWLEKYLHRYGVVTTRLGELPNKASLIARIGPQAEGGLVFAGHTDVVPVEGQPWSRSPFVSWSDGERIYGRGSCDMKGFLACVLAQVPEWTRQSLIRPVYLVFTRDEEIGCLGADAVARCLAAIAGEKPLVVVGEPTLMQPVVAQKGIATFCTTVYGRAAHSSQIGQGVSAIHVAARLITTIEQVMTALIADGYVDEGFDVPYSSLHVGTVHGGTAVNITAQECRFHWEIRNLPTQPVEEILTRISNIEAELLQSYKGLSISTERCIQTVPALANRNNHHLLTLVRRHLPPKVQMQSVAYATEAGIFQQYGLETLILGPGSIRQAHQADEWIAMAQLEQCAQFVRAAVADYCHS